MVLFQFCTKNEGNDYILVEIADNGSQGIPEVHDHVFLNLSLQQRN